MQSNDTECDLVGGGQGRHPEDVKSSGEIVGLITTLLAISLAIFLGRILLLWINDLHL